MFEPLPAPRRRPMFAVSAAAHAALALALVVPPLLATPPAPELDGFVRIDFVPVLIVEAPARERREDLLRKGKEGVGAGATAPRSSDAGPRAHDSGAPRSPLVQPAAEVGALPDPTGGSSDPFTIEEIGERSERGDVPGETGDSEMGSRVGCEGCKVISADALGVTPPVALDAPAMAYPELARRAHVEGVLLLEAIIDADGSVRDVRVIRGVSPLLDPVAVEAVRRWRYRPARIGAHSVAVALKVVVTFSLRNP